MICPHRWPSVVRKWVKRFLSAIASSAIGKGMENFTLARFGCFLFCFLCVWSRQHRRIPFDVVCAVRRQISAVNEDGTFNVTYVEDNSTEKNVRWHSQTIICHDTTPFYAISVNKIASNLDQIREISCSFVPPSRQLVHRSCNTHVRMFTGCNSFALRAIIVSSKIQHSERGSAGLTWRIVPNYVSTPENDSQIKFLILKNIFLS